MMKCPTKIKSEMLLKKENNITVTWRSVVKNAGKEKLANGAKGVTTSIVRQETDTLKAAALRLENRMFVASRGLPVVVSQKQYESVSSAHQKSLDLLDCSGTALLLAMESVIPPEGSGRTIGEYTGQNLRQMAKSVCDLINTKTSVVRTMYQITRDEI